METGNTADLAGNEKHIAGNGSYLKEGLIEQMSSISSSRETSMTGAINRCANNSNDIDLLPRSNSNQQDHQAVNGEVSEVRDTASQQWTSGHSLERINKGEEVNRLSVSQHALGSPEHRSSKTPKTQRRYSGYSMYSRATSSYSDQSVTSGQTNMSSASAQAVKDRVGFAAAKGHVYFQSPPDREFTFTGYDIMSDHDQGQSSLVIATVSLFENVQS